MIYTIQLMDSPLGRLILHVKSLMFLGHYRQVETSITATCSEPVTVEPNSLTLKDINNKTIQGTTTSPNQDGKTLEFKLSNRLDPSTTYIATITGVKDLAGNTLSTPKSWKFTTTA